MTTTKEAAKVPPSLDPTPKSLSPSSDVMANLVQQVKTMQAAPPQWMWDLFDLVVWNVWQRK